MSSDRFNLVKHVSAARECLPDLIELKSDFSLGRWLKVYMELPQGSSYDPSAVLAEIRGQEPMDCRIVRALHGAFGLDEMGLGVSIWLDLSVQDFKAAILDRLPRASSVSTGPLVRHWPGHLEEKEPTKTLQLQFSLAR